MHACNLGMVIALARTYVVMHVRMRGRGRRVGVVSIAELVAKVRTVKISSGAAGSIFAKVCTSENFPLYGITW